jgi:hypothetical protein
LPPQLVEQNSSLKKEVAIAERKLTARNERIQSLESLLQDAQEKLISQNQKYVYFIWCNGLISLTQTNTMSLGLKLSSKLFENA